MSGLSPHQRARDDRRLLPKDTVKMLEESSIAAATTTGFEYCRSMKLIYGRTLSLTVECTFNALATMGIVIHLHSSYDGQVWDTEPWNQMIPPFAAGATVCLTESLNPDVVFLKARVENLDGTQTVTNVKITATVGE